MLTHKQTHRVEDSCIREHVLSHCHSRGGKSASILTFSHVMEGKPTLTISQRGKHTHSHSVALRKRGSHPLTYRFESTLTFTYRRTL